MGEKAEDGDAARGADEDFSVDDDRRDELVAVAEVVAVARRPGCCCRVLGEVGRVVGVQDGGR